MQAAARLSSTAASRKAITGVSSTIVRSCYRACRGKAHAAALSAQEAPKGSKRVTKQERKVRMVEFIDKYKESNNGKFPSMSMIRQHVGGSHYTVREVLQEVKYNEANSLLDKSKAAQVHEKAEFAEDSKPADGNGNTSLESESFDKRQSADDLLPCQKDAATSTEIMEKSETGRSQESKTTPGSSHHNEETEARKQDVCTADNVERANDSTVSYQTESDVLKTEDSISLGPETKPGPANQSKADGLNLNDPESLHISSESTISDQTEGHKAIKENIPDREASSELEHGESSKITLLGSLKSFAYGIRNFWKKL